MLESDFSRSCDAAIERMRKMNEKSAFYVNQNKKEPPAPTPKQSPQKPPQNQGFLSSFNIPFLDSLTKDGDSALILGLLLILISEQSDKMLLFALIYILL